MFHIKYCYILFISIKDLLITVNIVNISYTILKIILDIFVINILDKKRSIKHIVTHICGIYCT